VNPFRASIVRSNVITYNSWSHDF